MSRKVKNPCPICGRPTDTQGWCGGNDHDAGNPYGGINCIVIPLEDQRASAGLGEPEVTDASIVST